MTGAQLTFWITNAIFSGGLFIAFYPGVRRQAQSAWDSALAASMAALLCGTSAALFIAFFVNAWSVVYQQ